jgi:uncharacterized iron-regulated membrane protein
MAIFRGPAMPRGVFVWLHRYVGLAMAGFLAIAGLTGSLIAFEPELDAWLNPQLRSVTTEKPALSVSELVQRAEATDRRARVSTVAFSAKSDAPVTLWVEPRSDGGQMRHAMDYDQMLTDPGTGRVLLRRAYGAAQIDREHLIPFVYVLHYSLHIPGQWGRWLMGGVALAWVLDCFVGFYLTLPRGRPFWQKWRPIWGIKPRSSAYRLNLDLHRSSGLWLWTLLLILATTSVYLNLNREVFTPIVRTFGSVSPDIWEAISSRPASAPGRDIGWNAAVAQAKTSLDSRRQAWSLRWVYHVPQNSAYVIDFGESDRTGRGLKYEQIAIDAESGQILTAHGYASGTAADAFLAWQYPLHSGQVAGLPGRILVCVLGIVVTMLSVTGIYLWWRKRLGQALRESGRSERSRSADVAPSDTNLMND